MYKSLTWGFPVHESSNWSFSTPMHDLSTLSCLTVYSHTNYYHIQLVYSSPRVHSSFIMSTIKSIPQGIKMQPQDTLPFHSGRYQLYPKVSNVALMVHYKDVILEGVHEVMTIVSKIMKGDTVREKKEVEKKQQCLIEMCQQNIWQRATNIRSWRMLQTLPMCHSK